LSEVESPWLVRCVQAHSKRGGKIETRKEGKGEERKGRGVGKRRNNKTKSEVVGRRRIAIFFLRIS